MTDGGRSRLDERQAEWVHAARRSTGSSPPRTDWRPTPAEVLGWLGFVLAVFALRAGAPPNPRLEALPLPVQVLVSPLMLLPFWLAVRCFHGPIAGWLECLPLPPLVRFLTVGLGVGLCLPLNWTICFDLCGTDLGHTGVQGADLSANPVINTLLYIGPFGGVMLSWYLLRRWYAFDDRHVFWVEGLRGALTEQGFVLPATLLSGDLVAATVLLTYLVPAYGLVFTVPFLLAPRRDLPTGTRRPRLGGYLLFVGVPWVLFYACAAAWYAPLSLVPHD